MSSLRTDPHSLLKSLPNAQEPWFNAAIRLEPKFGPPAPDKSCAGTQTVSPALQARSWAAKHVKLRKAYLATFW